MSSFHRNASSSNNNGSGSSSRRPRQMMDQMWNSFRGRSVPMTTTTERGAVVVGTQALALQRMQENQERYRYPKEGFVTPIEHSLLYAMICEPKIYPESVVLEQIANEDFESFLEVEDNSSSNPHQHQEEQRVSYAQLSALLAQSAEKFPNAPPKEYAASSTNSNNSNNNRRNPYDYDNDEYDDYKSKRKNNTIEKEEGPQRIPQALCKAVLSCVTRYADQHQLDRATEVKELLEPVEKHMMKNNANSLLPIYIAYSVGLFIPGGVGLGLTIVSLSAMIAASEKADQNAQTVQNMNSQRRRVAGMETAGLLDEVEGY